MARAKYGSDPRHCPGCGRKTLYSRRELLGTFADEIERGDGVYCDVDICNRCRGRFFGGELLQQGRNPSVRSVEVKALLSCAKRHRAAARRETSMAEEAERLAAKILANAEPA